MPRTPRPPTKQRLDVVAVANEAKEHRIEFALYPKFWTDFHEPTVLVWNSVPFDKTQAKNIPTKVGVYAFIVKPQKPCAGLLPEYLLYIGETHDQTLRRRFGQYIRGIDNLEERPKLVTTLPKYKGFTHFHFAEIQPGGLTPAQIEQKLLSSFLPPLNSKYSGIASTAVAAF